MIKTMEKKLFIPGPTEVAGEVLVALGGPMIGHRSKAASALQKSISDKMREVFCTQNEIILSTSSGSGLMEGAVRSCTAKKAVVFSVGAFGDRWYKMAVANGVPADIVKSELGQATTADMVDKALSTGQYDCLCVTHNETATGIMNPVEEIAEVVKKYPDVIWCVDAVSSAAGSKIETDKLGIDVLITSTQKALAVPPGMAICSLSQKAYERTERVQNRGLYFDLRELYDFVKQRDYQYPSTPSLPLMYALDCQLDRMMKEGMENRYARHKEMAEYMRSWSREYFALFPNPLYLSNTLTVIDNTKGIDVAGLNKALGERGKQLGNGYGALKDKTFRIAHMGELSLADMHEITSDIQDILGL